ncbi:Uncharacterised protein [Providencia rettgeri]|uniref:Uncharacterized protein n=1 Tax=Providencia rettgeri TaxID=587 RepID=A0A9N8D5I4_PRORE|nr:Uncharacterised protein [Providencia rettgeri]CAB5705486.1 Uncharacterised protein [Providencia rettgeri]CAC9211799.1 Uncharacterised protein [Providencia rettgeri]CAC9278288.1 Uncharacterised protein [Providencia rettgeri]
MIFLLLGGQFLLLGTMILNFKPQLPMDKVIM